MVINLKRKIVASITIAICIAILIMNFDALFYNREFDRRKWAEKTFENESSCLRGKMVHDLFESQLHLGDKRTKVEILLGPSDYKGEPAYVLGECGGFDLSVLHLSYDEQERLQRFEIKQH